MLDEYTLYGPVQAGIDKRLPSSCTLDPRMTTMRSDGRRNAVFGNGVPPRYKPSGPSKGSHTSLIRNAGVHDPGHTTLKTKFEAIDVLLEILLHQEELTIKEYTINNSKIRVLVIEDTEF